MNSEEKKETLEQFKELEVIKIDYDSDTYFEQIFLDSLNILTYHHHKFHKDEPAFLLFKLLNCTKYYLANLYKNGKNETREKLIVYFEEIERILKQDLIGKKIEQRAKETAIGEFVEGLIYYGMPRLPAIKATKNWLSLGQSTVRTYHENYRKGGAIKHMEQCIAYSSEAEIIRGYLKENTHFPFDHPKAKKAFNKLKYNYENWQEFLSSKPF